jgi:sugar fermentation stimulation protein A
VFHAGIRRVAPAWDIDPRYGEALLAALDAGVEAMAWAAAVAPAGLVLERELPVETARP